VGDLIAVHDDFLADPLTYRARALAQRFRDVHDGPVVFHGMAPCADPTVPMQLVATYPTLRPTLSFFRLSPQGQVEPHAVHTDTSMGTVTALLYLQPDPPTGDGTQFLKHVKTGATRTRDNREAADWFTPDAWERVALIEAKFNRLVVFPAALFHSRAIQANYGTDPESARLLQIVFCEGELT